MNQHRRLRFERWFYLRYGAERLHFTIDDPMRFRPLIRPLRSPRRARVLGALALLMVLFATVLVSFRLIAVEGALAALGFSTALSAVAIAFAIYSLARIWDETGKGTFDSLLGILWSMPVLALTAGLTFSVTQTESYPDLATNVNDPPRFDTLVPEDEASAVLDQADGATRMRLQLEHPDLSTLYVERPGWHIAEVIETLRDDRGWRLARKEQVSDRNFETEFSMTGPVPFMPYNVAVRVVDDGIGSVIDARSISNLPLHDFGTNSAALRNFLNQLSIAIESTRPPVSDL